MGKGVELKDCATLIIYVLTHRLHIRLVDSCSINPLDVSWQTEGTAKSKS